MFAVMADLSTPSPAAGLPPRLWAALAAAGCALALVGAVHIHVAGQIRRDTGWFKGPPEARNFTSVAMQKLTGIAVQAGGFRNPEFLPVYGSSELTQPQPNRPDDFFRSRPTGFDVFPVAYPGETDLLIATKLAALGPAARGRKAVVFLSPSWFQVAQLDPAGFGFNFSPLQGSRIAFGGALSAGLQRDFARRLLDYPDLVAQFPLLKAALGGESANRPVDRLLLAALRPLGAVQNVFLGESDFAKVALWLRDHPLKGNGPPPAVPTTIDWDARIREADEHYSRQPALTTYSTGPRTPWDDKRSQLFLDTRQPDVSPEADFERVCLSSKEWTDLDLLLRTARELDLRLLLVCQPFNDDFWELHGLTPRASALFYHRLREAVAPYPSATLLTFPQAGTDPHWYVDSTHPTAKAWLAYDRALDAFFHAP